MAGDNIPIDDHILEDLRQKNREIECHNKMLIDDNRKRGIKCEDLQKEKLNWKERLASLKGRLKHSNML